ncbi:murein DD-endopeptidase MepM/ murein hydrolase activator NlpD [Streptomyces sp. V4I23]|uniref:M23 family metallopeptidase n=1 Tax=Streptomyces sp. V4I23 TaxID=3042282 RepID=UPI0027878D87|nr:M23 family metallopeptidase [Streptomyces sp. V4I23]MDQ1008033.1 murein DD-endopeptidase MepM/ murein hydrolase activator NlpD [Streptomyces sp. V4I23]
MNRALPARHPRRALPVLLLLLPALLASSSPRGPGATAGTGAPAAEVRPVAGAAGAAALRRPVATPREPALGGGAPASPRSEEAGGNGSARSWPVGPPRPAVVRGWAPPASPYGAGHRGVDLAARPGTPVRAAAASRVTFAGRVANRGVLVISLTDTGDPPLRTTYEPVRPLVDKGEEVAAGQVVATIEAGPAHCAAGCLHWGLLRGTEYLNPLSLLPPSILRRPPSRLLPVFGVPLP